LNTSLYKIKRFIPTKDYQMSDSSMANHELLKENSALKKIIQELEQAEATRKLEFEAKVLERTQSLEERVVLLTRELDEFKRVEDALRDTESQFQLFVERAPVAIGVWNLDGTGRYVNQKYIEILGLNSVEDVVGRPAFEFFAPQFREASKERTERRLKGLPVPAEFESIALRADGTEFPVYLAIAPIQLASGTVSIAFMEDITDRKKSEEKLKASELRYKQLFEAIPESVLLIGTDGCVVAANQASARLHGYETPQQLEGFYTPLLIAEKDRARATQTQTDIVQGGERPARYYTEVRRDGSEFLAEVVSTTLRGPQQEVTGYIGITRDITAFVKANEALKASEEKYHNLGS
jgi:PAS domain S-box-containing protein